MGADGQVRVHDRATGSTRPVSLGPRRGGRLGEVVWSPDGRELLALARAGLRGYGLLSFPLDGSTTERRTPWTWALDWIGADDVDWSSR